MSPSASWAKSVMPDPDRALGVAGGADPLVLAGVLQVLRIHGGSLVRWGVGRVGRAGVSGRLLAAAGLRILRSRGLADAGDLDRLELLDLDRGAVVGLQRLDRPGREGERGPAARAGRRSRRGRRAARAAGRRARCRPTAFSNELSAPSRIESLNSIASAPAVRSSWTVSSSEPDAATRLVDSVIVIRRPGPVTGTSPAMMLRVLTRCSASSRAADARPALVGSSSRRASEPVDLAPRALGGAGQAVEHLDQLALAQPGVGVVGLGVAHLHDEREAEHGEQDRDDRLAPRRPDEGVPQALPAGLGIRVGAVRRRRMRLVRVLGVGRRVGHGTQAWKTCLRMAATLEKMRMPSTTTTPVRQLGADAELVAEVDDRRGDDDVADEGDDEDLVVEDAVEVGAQATEDGVEGGHHRDRQVVLEAERHVGGEDQPGDDAEQQAQRSDHGALPSLLVRRRDRR